MSKLPLEGIRVVELGIAWTGPGAATALGDFGAEVIKVESVEVWSPVGRGPLARPSKEWIMSQSPYGGGYPNREPGKHPWNVRPITVSVNRNKLGMTVKNLAEPRSRENFLKLIKASDVLVENNHPETLGKLNIGYEVLKKVKSDIIVLRLSGAGLTGPYSTIRSHGQQLDALSGHMSLRGYADMGDDATSDCPVTDYTGPLVGVSSVMMALLHRHKTGEGQLIEVGQLETLPYCLGEAMMDYFMNQRVHTRIGNRDFHGAAPCGCYRCKGEDEWINITVTSDVEWEDLKKSMGSPSWANEERFSNAYQRWHNQDDLDKFIGEWTVTRDKYEVMLLLQKAGVAAGPVLHCVDSYNDPHLKARGFFEKITHEDAGTHLYPGMAWKFSKTPLTIRRPAVRFGEHNEYVYKHILKVSDKEYTELVNQGHISTEPSPNIP